MQYIPASLSNLNHHTKRSASGSCLHILRTCRQTLVSYKGMIQLDAMPDNLTPPLELHAAKVCGVSLTDCKHTDQKQLCIHLICQLCDARGQKASARAFMKIDQPIYACNEEFCLSAQLHLIHSCFLRPAQFHICAQIMFTEMHDLSKYSDCAQRCTKCNPVFSLYPNLPFPTARLKRQ